MLKMWKGLKAGLPSVYWHRWKSRDLHIWIFSIFQEYTLFTQIFSVLQQYSPNYSNIQYLATVQTYLLKYLMFCKSIGSAYSHILQTKLSGISPFEIFTYQGGRTEEGGVSEGVLWESGGESKAVRWEDFSELRYSAEASAFEWVDFFILLEGKFSSQVGSDIVIFSISVLLGKMDMMQCAMFSPFHFQNIPTFLKWTFRSSWRPRLHTWLLHSLLGLRLHHVHQLELDQTDIRHKAFKLYWMKKIYVYQLKSEYHSIVLIHCKPWTEV